jgi:hypothetical protein
MRRRLARRIVDFYPRAWRDRYEREFVALLDDRDDLGWRDVADIGRGAVREWMRLTPAGRAAAAALDAWLAAVTWTLIVATLGSLLVGLARVAIGVAPEFEMPFLRVDLARSLVTDMPAAVAVATLFAAPWLLAARSTRIATTRPVMVRLVAVLPAILIGAWFVFSAEQLTGLVAAAWVVSGHAIGSARKVFTR